MSAANLRSSDALPADKAIIVSNIVQNDLTEKAEDDEISTSTVQAGGKFACDICDFVSNWTNGLSVHMTRKHQQIDQLDGANSFIDNLDNDDKYWKTVQYWEQGKVGTVFQNFCML